MLKKPRATEFATNLEGKVVVADTSSLLTAGASLLDSLPACHLVIPAIVVKELEEKRTHATLGFLAREWLRLLEELRRGEGKKLSIGVAIPQHPHIEVSVEPNHSTQADLPKHLQDGSNDSTILAVARALSKEGHEVVLLSNDTPMRLHATLDIELDSVEYNSTLASGAQTFDGRLAVHLTDDEWLNSDAVQAHGQKMEHLIQNKVRAAEEDATHLYVTVENEGAIKPVGHFLYKNGFVETVSFKQTVFDITARSVEQNVALSYLRTPPGHEPNELAVVSLAGGAGTGKTLLTLAAGLDEVKEGNFRKVVVFRSLHEMGQGQELGFLPGDVDDKMEVWAGAVHDALEVIAKERLTKGTTRGKIITPTQIREEAKTLKSMIEVSPITYLRGRSLSNCYLVLEEAQNFSRSEVLNILSRAGEGSKLVLTWDSTQVDNRFLQSGARSDMWSVVDSLKQYDIFAHITLRKTERSRVAEIASGLLES